MPSLTTLQGWEEGSVGQGKACVPGTEVRRADGVWKLTEESRSCASAGKGRPHCCAHAAGILDLSNGVGGHDPSHFLFPRCSHGCPVGTRVAQTVSLWMQQTLWLVGAELGGCLCPSSWESPAEAAGREIASQWKDGPWPVPGSGIVFLPSSLLDHCPVSSRPKAQMCL